MPTEITAAFIESGVLGLGWPLAVYLVWHIISKSRADVDRLIEIISANTQANTRLADKIEQATK